MRSSRAALLASALLVVGLYSCGERPGSSRSARGGGVSADGSAPGVAVPESVPAYPFKLVNPRVYAVLVYASAGAGEVLLDTVAAGDSVRLAVRVGSDPLKLSAFDLDGNELSSEYLELPDVETASSSPDSAAPIRWELRSSP